MIIPKTNPVNFILLVFNNFILLKNHFTSVMLLFYPHNFPFQQIISKYSSFISTSV